MTPQTREKLLLTAARLFHEQGYAATGVATILREAGVNSGSLYHFFANKEALLGGVLQWYEDSLWPVVLGPVEQAEPDPVERIFRLLDWYREGMVASECRLGCPIGNLALEVSDTYPELRPRIDANFRGWAAGIEKWLQEAAERLPADCDTRALSRFVLTVMEGGLMQARAARDLAAFDDSVQILRDYLKRLLADHEAPTTAKESRP
jgi:AcrR family transcriptional regulator